MTKNVLKEHLVLGKIIVSRTSAYRHNKKPQQQPVNFVKFILDLLVE